MRPWLPFCPLVLASCAKTGQLGIRSRVALRQGSIDLQCQALESRDIGNGGVGVRGCGQEIFYALLDGCASEHERRPELLGGPRPAASSSP